MLWLANIYLACAAWFLVLIQSAPYDDEGRFSEGDQDGVQPPNPRNQQ